VTGKQLADYFGDPGYGWDIEVVRLVLAVIFRAGALEVTHQARRYRNYQEPQARAPVSQIPAFRSASFAPRESIDLSSLHPAPCTWRQKAKIAPKYVHTDMAG
jgi:hypothetical protein